MQTAAAALVTAADVEAFGRDGFVQLRGLLDPAEVARLGAAVDAAVAARKAGDGRALAEKSPYEQSFIQCQYLWEDFPDVAALTFHPRVAGAAAALIGADAVRLWHDQALYKEAGGRATDAHQDHPYWPIAELKALTAWIPLVAVDEETGCMGYAPGSHTGPAEFVDIFRAPGSGAALMAKQARAPVFAPAQPGDVLFHHGLTAHLAGPNRSGATRRVYTAIYFADGCTRAATGRHPSVDRDGIAAGAVIDGAATPVAWPLPGGRLPEAAAWPEAYRQSPGMARAERLGVVPGGTAD